MAAFRGNFKNRTQGDESIYKNRFMRRPDMRCLFVLLIMFYSCHGYQEQRFIMEPHDQSAILGSHVILPCRIENKAGSLQWTKDDFGLGTHRNLSGYERYKMIGSDEEGDYSLDIRNITLEDDATYQCQVSSGLNGEPGIRSRSAQLTILIAPDPPKITQGAFIDATEDKAVDIECVSMGGKPAAEITWVDSNQIVIKKGIDSRVDLLTDGQRFITRSVLRLIPRKEHHNQSITCQAQNTADRAYRMATVHIEVKYAPKVKVFVKSEDDNEKVPEGDDAVIVCDVDANPLPKQYNWYINNKPVIGDYDREMMIFNVSRKLNGAIVECEVGNSVGVSSEKKVLEVTYPPSFKARPKNVAAEEGATVTLNCDVDGYPQPEIRWLLYEPGRIGVKGKTANLKLKVNNGTAGRYLCKASVDGYHEIEAQAHVFIKGPPKIISNLTQFGMEGEMVSIECAAVSVPKPDDISWFYNGREISVIHNQEYAIVETPLSDGIVKTSLVIKSSQSKHFGLYNCSITNEYGNANEGILLKAHKTFPLIMILVAVSSVIVLLSFVILIIMCIKRKRNKTKNVKEKSDVKENNSDYKESDRSSNISDYKIPHEDGTYDLDYTSSSHTGSNLKLAGLPLAGPVSLPNIRHDDPLMQFRYSNDYTDPMFVDAYLKAPGYLSYAEYTPDYPLPPGLRVQSPSNLDVANANRSLQGSLTRSIDTASTVPMSGASQNNSLQRNKPQDESETINHLGLPVGTEGPPIYAQPTTKGTLHNGGVLPSGLDVRYAATYGNPYLRANTGGFGAQGQAPKSSATSAPPPYSARNSVAGPPGNGNQPSQATHV